MLMMNPSHGYYMTMETSGQRHQEEHQQQEEDTHQHAQHRQQHQPLALEELEEYYRFCTQNSSTASDFPSYHDHGGHNTAHHHHDLQDPYFPHSPNTSTRSYDAQDTDSSYASDLLLCRRKPASLVGGAVASMSSWSRPKVPTAAAALRSPPRPPATTTVSYSIPATTSASAASVLCIPTSDSGIVLGEGCYPTSPPSPYSVLSWSPTTAPISHSHHPVPVPPYSQVQLPTSALESQSLRRLSKKRRLQRQTPHHGHSGNSRQQQHQQPQPQEPAGNRRHLPATHLACLPTSSLSLFQGKQQELQMPPPSSTVTAPLSPATTSSTPSPRQQPSAPPTPSSSDVDCYTCRRRRVKCDRQLPLCAKCDRTKLECLGYKKPLVWNKGVASRGKMMGKTFPTPPPPIDNTARRKSAPVKRTPAASPATPLPPPSPLVGDEASTAVTTVVSRRETDATALSIPTARALPNERAIGLHSPSGMGSPFSHLDHDAQEYMKYFETRVASDFVLFDRLLDNPYRNLLPLASSHPALLNAMLAVAARHKGNVSGTGDTRALPYKGLSFKHLSADLQRHGPSRILTEPTLAVVMLFLFFETLDGGLDTWKIHLRGARRLIAMCVAAGASESSVLRVFMSHVTLIDIIGRTLSPARAIQSPSSAQQQVWEPNHPGELLAILRDGEAYNFLGCPAELLEILHTITLLKSSPQRTDPTPLLARISAFDLTSYISTRPVDEDPNLIHLVSSYQSAARIYALEALAHTPCPPAEHAVLREHLSALPEGSCLVKGAVWPVFVAGTGARTEDEREWVRGQLKRLWGMLPQWNIRNAGSVLEEIWRGGGGWEVLEKSGRDWLFI